MEPNEGEMLVDGKLLSYAYLEIGIIETIARYVLCPLILMSVIDTLHRSLLAYFVVFYKNGFTPGDLVTAQKNGGTVWSLSA